MILDGTPLLWSSMTLTNGSGSSRSGWNTNQRSKAKLLPGTETAARPFLDCCFSPFTIFSVKQKEIKHARAIKPSSSSKADNFFSGVGKRKRGETSQIFDPHPTQKKLVKRKMPDYSPLQVLFVQQPVGVCNFRPPEKKATRYLSFSTLPFLRVPVCARMKEARKKAM